jgi:hypothetical protein
MQAGSEIEIAKFSAVLINLLKLKHIDCVIDDSDKTSAFIFGYDDVAP